MTSQVGLFNWNYFGPSDLEGNKVAGFRVEIANKRSVSILPFVLVRAIHNVEYALWWAVPE